MTNLINMAALLYALAGVESGWKDDAVNGDCVGRYQLRQVYVADANRINQKAKYTDDERHSNFASSAMVTIVLTHYYRQGMTVRDLAIVHRHGYGAWRNGKRDDDYASRVEALYNERTKGN